MESSEMSNEKDFLNGDIYEGDFKGIFPHGKGKYTWSNGTVYEGDWLQGMITGKGKILWPSRVIYEGEFSGGYLHGFGTLINPDGSVYRGTWRMNVQHGLGRKDYSNSDVYDGSWKEGVQEGSGSYVWSNGNMYVGNWRNGKMSGRGDMKWVNGDFFDGFWLNGVRHGSGCYRFADGGYYFGTWTKGLKDGRGTYYPAGCKHPSLGKYYSISKLEGKRKEFLCRISSLDSEEHKVPISTVKRSLSEKISLISLTSFKGGSGRIPLTNASVDGGGSYCGSNREFSSLDISGVVSPSFDGGQPEVQANNSDVVYEREYMQGVLIKESVRKSTRHPKKIKQRNKFHPEEEKRRSCINIVKGYESYYLMLNLQLGIRYTVGKITPVPMREVRSTDFGERARIQMYFPKKGSQFTPPHYSVDFFWKDYCPMVFRNLREMFKLDAAEYMMSICGDNGLRELSSPGKSGSIFFISHDDRFFIKTLRKSELKVLLKMLPCYHDHVKELENTLITKFFGIHRITWRSGKKVRFVVMGNMFCTELRIHRRFDLKGSKFGRKTNSDNIDENTTLKDLDLSYEFHMDKLLRVALFTQLELDCKFLKSQQIIDYSLLLGIHFRAPEHLDSLLEVPDELRNHNASQPNEIMIPPKGLLLVTHEPSSVSTAPGSHVRGNTLRAFSVGDKEVDLLLPGTARLRVQLGVNMPAQANRKLLQENDSAEVELFEVYDVVLYLGIIDILQNYNLRKRIEHTCKSLKHDSLSISCVEPECYSSRFLNFLEKVFPCGPE